jgi:hypothetical protein
MNRVYNTNAQNVTALFARSQYPPQSTEVYGLDSLTVGNPAMNLLPCRLLCKAEQI